MPRVSLQKIVKNYSKGHRAVNGIDLAIEDGELLVLVGPAAR